MTSRNTLVNLVKDLAVALRDHHMGTNTTRPFAQTYDRDRRFLHRAEVNLAYDEKRKDIYTQALLAVQVGACNSSGLINSLSEWSDQIWEDANRYGGGTREFNTHPVVQLIVSQLAYLAGLTLGLDTIEAEAMAEKMAVEFNKEQQS